MPNVIWSTRKAKDFVEPRTETLTMAVHVHLTQRGGKGEKSMSILTNPFSPLIHFECSGQYRILKDIPYIHTQAYQCLHIDFIFIEIQRLAQFRKKRGNNIPGRTWGCMFTVYPNMKHLLHNVTERLHFSSAQCKSHALGQFAGHRFDACLLWNCEKDEFDFCQSRRQTEIHSTKGSPFKIGTIDLWRKVELRTPRGVAYVMRWCTAVVLLDYDVSNMQSWLWALKPGCVIPTCVLQLDQKQV